MLYSHLLPEKQLRQSPSFSPSRSRGDVVGMSCLGRVSIETKLLGICNLANDLGTLYSDLLSGVNNLILPVRDLLGTKHGGVKKCSLVPG